MKTGLTTKLPYDIKMNIMARFRSPFPYYLNDDRKNSLLAASISVFVVLFMNVYTPFRMYDQYLSFFDISLFGAVTFMTMFTSIIVMPRVFPELFEPVQWTLGKYLLQTVIQCVVIGLLCIVLDILYICPEKPLAEVVPNTFMQVALIGIIPTTFMTLLLKNKMLRHTLQQAICTNRELETIRTLKRDVANPVSHEIVLHSDTSETLDLNLPDLLFIAADDNYSTIYWQSGDVVMKKLLRVNLKNLEQQIDNSFTIRCHRSFMVNIHAISSVTGNTNGYKLRIKQTDHYIPVSRPKGKEVMDKIRQLKNMMELY